jgi:hypothetical protein
MPPHWSRGMAFGDINSDGNLVMVILNVGERRRFFTITMRAVAIACKQQACERRARDREGGIPSAI